MCNIYITNLRDNILHVYNGNKIEAVCKYSILNEIINNHLEKTNTTPTGSQLAFILLYKQYN